MTTTATYSWCIMSVDSERKSMIVQYNYNDKSGLYNLPAIRFGEDVVQFIDAYAPRDQWEGPVDFSHIQIGQTGTNYVNRVTVADSAAQTSAQEAYLRSLIYQVLDEIKDATV